MRVDFVANASHELRTPLSTLIGYTETLREQADEIDPETRERFLSVVHDEARRMQRVVEDLISLSRIEAEKFTAPTEAVALEPLIDHALESARRMADERGSALVRDVAAYSIGHGANDAQKTMGIITVLLFSTGYLHGEFHVPLWVILAAQVAMGLGTLMGGWRIVRTMGSKITRLTPHQGFCAEIGGAIMLFGATAFGIPVSTTHTITGAIMGVGAARRASAVRWGVAGNIIVAWIVTIPAAAAIAALVYACTRMFG
jgi:hypothetical protein